MVVATGLIPQIFQIWQVSKGLSGDKVVVASALSVRIEESQLQSLKFLLSTLYEREIKSKSGRYNILE